MPDHWNLRYTSPWKINGFDRKAHPNKAFFALKQSLNCCFHTRPHYRTTPEQGVMGRTIQGEIACIRFAWANRAKPSTCPISTLLLSVRTTTRKHAKRGSFVRQHVIIGGDICQKTEIIYSLQSFIRSLLLPGAD